jgi:glutathione S-transferase
LLATGPHGKAPLLITGVRDGSRSIPESSAIATYLIRTFDISDTFGLRNGDWIRDEMLLSIISTSLARATFLHMMLDFGMIKNGEGNAGSHFDGPELRNVLGVLERELKEGPEGGWFMGRKPGRADIMAEFGISSVKQRKYLDLKAEFPGLDAWLERVYERDAWKRGLEKGNGYDLSVFPQRPHL